MGLHVLTQETQPGSKLSAVCKLPGRPLSIAIITGAYLLYTKPPCFAILLFQVTCCKIWGGFVAPKCLKLEAGKPLPIVRLQHATIVNYLTANYLQYDALS